MSTHTPAVFDHWHIHIAFNGKTVERDVPDWPTLVATLASITAALVAKGAIPQAYADEAASSLERTNARNVLELGGWAYHNRAGDTGFLLRVQAEPGLGYSPDSLNTAR